MKHITDQIQDGWTPPMILKKPVSGKKKIHLGQSDMPVQR